MRFRIGQEVVCIKKGAWIYSDGTQMDNKPNPKFNDIVIVDGHRKGGFLYLKGYTYICNDGSRTSYYETRFAPILENLDEIKESLNEKVS